MAARDRWRVVPAAGGVLWRDAGAALESGGSAAPDTAGSAAAGIEVALVHRPKYDDWSLPKGKLLPAEQSLVGGVREVAEETGITARAGRRSAWLGPDRLRPLDATGQAQAQGVCTVAPCFRPQRVISGDPSRCVDTVQTPWALSLI